MFQFKLPFNMMVEEVYNVLVKNLKRIADTVLMHYANLKVCKCNFSH